MKPLQHLLDELCSEHHMCPHKHVLCVSLIRDEQDTLLINDEQRTEERKISICLHQTKLQV